MAGLLKFFLILFVIYWVLRISWRLVGPRVARWVIGRLARRLEQQAQRQQAAYQSQFSPFDERPLADGARLRVPKAGPAPTPPPGARPAVQDVDFEEVP